MKYKERNNAMFMNTEETEVLVTAQEAADGRSGKVAE